MSLRATVNILLQAVPGRYTRSWSNAGELNQHFVLDSLDFILDHEVKVAIYIVYLCIDLACHIIYK